MFNVSTNDVAGVSPPKQVTGSPDGRRRGLLVASAVTAIAVVGAAGAVAALRLSRATRAAPAAVPSLWSDAPVECPVSGRAQAHALAVEKRITADGKRERHPFHLADGAQGVVLYQEAAACFRAAGNEAAAAQLSETASQLRSEVDDEYRVRRLRLSRALATGDRAIAAREVVRIRSLLTGKQGSYVDWINTVARSLDVDKE